MHDGHYIKDKKGFLTLLGLLFALAIICWMAYMVLNAYLLQPKISTEQRIDQSLAGQGITTYNYQTIRDTARQKIEEVTQKHMNELETLKKELGQ